MMKRFVTILLASVAALLFSIDASAQMDKVSVKSYKISRISPRGFTSVDGAVQITIVNAGEQFTLSNISGVVYKQGMRFVTGSAANVVVPKGESNLVINGNATLCRGIGLWDVLKCINFKADDYTADVSLRVSVEGQESRLVNVEGMSVGAVLKR